MCNQRPTLRAMTRTLCCGLFFVITGCTLLGQRNTPCPPPVVCPPEPVEITTEQKEEIFSSNLKPGEYEKEIARLQRVILNHPERSEKAEAYFKLAKLYASYNNPDMNYEVALQQLTNYITFHPQAGKDYDVQNRLNLLEKITQLSEENTTLKQSIEDLKILDQQIEQKRELYR